MFVENLSSKSQKEVFLSFAQALVTVDGESQGAELSLLKEIGRQLPGIKANAKVVNAILSNVKDGKGTGIKAAAKIFSSRQEKVSVMLELLGIAVIDNKFQDQERQLLAKLSNALGFSKIEMAQFESWVSVQFELTKMAGSFMREE
jgi:tellurite resistance protein